MKPPTQNSQQGWTRADLVAVLLGLGLCGAGLFPLLAATGRDGKLAACAHNLKVMGEAMRSWANDHGDRTTARTPWAEGGTMPDATDPWQGNLKPGADWFEWLSLSNHLSSPKRLVCPADYQKRYATHWEITDAKHGFPHANHRNNSLSYLFGLEAVDWAPRSILSGDRNIPFAGSGGCSANVNNARFIFAPSIGATHVAWTNWIHGTEGNLLFMDGTVERTSSETLRRRMAETPEDNGPVHFLTPD